MKYHVKAYKHNAVPGSVFRQGAYTWTPADGPDFTASSQLQSLKDWYSDPSRFQTYVVTSPSMGRAQLMAAHLLNHHVVRHPLAAPYWATVYDKEEDEFTGSVYEKLLVKDMEITMLVLTLTKTTSLQVEVARDLLVKYMVPTVVVASGVYPTELARAMYLSAHRIAYINTSTVKELGND